MLTILPCFSNSTPRPYTALVSTSLIGAEGVTTSEASLRRLLAGLPGVDQVGLEVRAAGLSTRSIKTTAKAYALDLAIRMVDLTTLEGADTPGKVRALCAKAKLLRVPRATALCGSGGADYRGSTAAAGSGSPS
jgi:deoxyribose-phosphate aldolase